MTLMSDSSETNKIKFLDNRNIVSSASFKAVAQTKGLKQSIISTSWK